VEHNKALVVQKLLEGKNLIRFGDGEFYVMEGFNIYFQPSHEQLTKRLKEIITTDSENLIKTVEVGRPRHYSLLNPNITYYSNISRIYDFKLIGQIISIFTGKNIVAIHHTEDWRLKKMFKKAKSLKFIIVKSEDCFTLYNETLQKCMLEPENTLFYLSCGPMAKVLGWDLHNAGRNYRVIDLGRFHDKLKKKMYRSYMA